MLAVCRTARYARERTAQRASSAPSARARMPTSLRLLLALVGLVLLAIGVFAVAIAITFGMLNAGRTHVMVLIAVAIFALIGGGWMLLVAWMGGRRAPPPRDAADAPPGPPRG